MSSEPYPEPYPGPQPTPPGKNPKKQPQEPIPTVSASEDTARYHLDPPGKEKVWFVIDQAADCPFSVVDVYSEMPHAERIAKFALALLNGEGE